MNPYDRIMQQYRWRKCLPVDRRSSDLFVTEFPKSGVTWLTSLMANVAMIKSGLKTHATFYNITQYVSDIHMSRDVGESPLSWPPFRIIKSHSEYNPFYVHVVYLVRHPSRVMESYYRFLTMHGESLPSYEEFLRSERLGVPAWRRHVRSWLSRDEQAQRLHLVRYEDLKADAVHQLNLLFENLGLEVDQAIVAEAVGRSQLESMKKSEELFASKNPRYSMTFVGDGRATVDTDDKHFAFIAGECREELEMLGYQTADSSEP